MYELFKNEETEKRKKRGGDGDPLFYRCLYYMKCWCCCICDRHFEFTDDQSVITRDIMLCM